METVIRELRAHLWRLVWASLVLGVVGVALFLSGGEEFRRGLGGMLFGWSLVNLMICWAGFRGKPPKSVGAFRGFLWFNEGLNVVYVLVGVGMVVWGSAGVQGAGVGVIVQGVNLLGLDGWLLGRTSGSRLGGG